MLVKFIYSEKATKLCEIFTLLLSYVVPVKSKVKISQKFVAFSEYMNFTDKFYRTHLQYASKFRSLYDFTREFNQDWYFLNSAFKKETHENLLVLHDLLLMKIRCLLLTGPIDKISLRWTIMHTTVLGLCVV